MNRDPMNNGPYSVFLMRVVWVERLSGEENGQFMIRRKDEVECRDRVSGPCERWPGPTANDVEAGAVGSNLWVEARADGTTSLEVGRNGVEADPDVEAVV